MSARTDAGKRSDLTEAEEAKLAADYAEIKAVEADAATKRSDFGKYVKSLMGDGRTRRGIARVLDCTDQTVTNLAGGRPGGRS